MSLRNKENQDKQSFDIETERASLIGPDNNSNNNVTRSCCRSSCCTFQNVIIVVLAIALIGLSMFTVFLKNDHEQRIIELEARMKTTQSRVDAIDAGTTSRLKQFDSRLNDVEVNEKNFQSSAWTEILKQNKTTSHTLHTLWSTVDEHEHMLIRLSNGTSNADVLDKLEETKVIVKDQLTSTQAHVDKRLVDAQHNVTLMLDSKVHEMQHVVSKATNNINEMEKNITSRLNSMSTKLTATVDEVSHSVADAQETISIEVESVRENIRQYVAVTNQQFAAENDFVKYELAGFFTLLGCLIFLWHMTSHSRHYHKPDVQRRVMAVLWMVPIYGITSWLSLVYPKAEPYFATLRDCFEAYVVYTFVGFLIAILSDGMTFNQLLRKLSKLVEHEKEAVEKYKHRQAHPEVAAEVLPGGEAVAALTKPKEHLVPPFPCCYQQNDCRSIAAAWLYQCQLMALQFVIMKPLLTLIPLLVAVGGAYDMDKDSPWGDNSLNWESPKLYIIFFQNVSVMIAFYGLLSLYHGVEKDLEWCDPWPKFLCIKGVVFATFWQNIAIQGMTMFDLLDERAASQISNLLICIEMLVASLAHIYIFPYQEWEPGYQKAKERTLQLRDTMALGDFLKDMKMMVTKWDPDNKAHKATPDHKDELDITALNDAETATLDRLTRDHEQMQTASSPPTIGGGVPTLIRDDLLVYSPLESDKLWPDESSPVYTNPDADMSDILQEEFEKRIHILEAEEQKEVAPAMQYYYQSSQHDCDDHASV